MEKKLKEAIKNSGNNLHLEVAGFLGGSGWDVDLSSYYCDDITDKPREIDIVAKKKIDIDGENDSFFVYLFLECKYLKNEGAFRMNLNSDQSAVSAIILNGLNKDEILRESEWKKSHHYLKAEYIAKLFDFSDNETQRAVFDGVTQPIKALLSFRRKMPPKYVCYPVVVYRGIDGFYLINKAQNTDAELDVLQKKNYLIFGVKYSFKTLSSPISLFSEADFYVDFIHQDILKDYLGCVEDEIAELKRYLCFQNKMKKNKTQ